jgi:hypothetical protein
VLYVRVQFNVGSLELAADALELQVMVFGGALLGRGGEVLRASGESSVGISFNKPTSW